MDAREHILSRLFVLLFNDEELRQFVVGIESRLKSALPAKPATLDHLAFEVAGLLERHNLVNHKLFEELHAARPLRSADVRQARRQLLPGSPLEPGARWGDGRFTLIRQIGEGGFAEVWLATEAVTGIYVALKILSPQATENPQIYRRFRRGANILAKLRHPSLVTVREPEAREGDRLYCVMDHVPGCTLAAAMDDATIPRDRLLDAVLEVGEALAHVHQHGVVHRDIHPYNILIDDGRLAVLIDFDLAGGRAFAPMTATVPIGTMPYVAPELLDGGEETAAADVYALAMTTLFVLLHRQLKPSAALREPKSLLEQDRVPYAMRAVLRAALDPDPEQRTPSVAEFCRALREARAYPEPGPASPTFAADGSLILWTPAEDPPPELIAAGLRLWPAEQAGYHVRAARRDGSELDRLLPYTALLQVATVLALRGRRPAWIGLTVHHTPVFVLPNGHLVLHDDSLPEPEDLQLAGERAAIPGLPLAMVLGGSANAPPSRHVVELAHEIRSGASDERRLRQLARFSKRPEAHDEFEPFVVSNDRGPQPAVDALLAELQAGPAIVGLRGVIGSGRSHTLRLLAARLAHSAMTSRTRPVVLLDAHGWRPPLRLASLLRDRGYTAVEAAAVLLAITSGECLLLLDGLEAPDAPLDADDIAVQVYEAFEALPATAARIIVATGPTLSSQDDRTFDLAPTPGPELHGLKVHPGPNMATAFKTALEKGGWLSLLNVPLLARPLFIGTSPISVVSHERLAPVLEQYVQLWTAHAAGLVAGATAEDFRGVLEALAAALWFGHADLRGDAILPEALQATCPVPGMTTVLTDGAILALEARRTVTMSWLIGEATRRSATPLIPFHNLTTAPQIAGSAYFVHDSILEWLLAHQFMRRLVTGDLAVLRGARPSPMLRMFCRLTNLWEQARERLLSILSTGSPVDLRESALLLASSDETLASTATRPWQLAGIRLENADLRKIRLEGADLTGARLARTNLAGSTLTGAILRDADLRLANLRSAWCDRVTANPANFTGTTLDGVCWRDADLRGAIFAASRSSRAPQDLRGARLDGIDTTGALWLPPNGLTCAFPSASGLPDEILSPRSITWNRDARWTRDSRFLVTIDNMGYVVRFHVDPLLPLNRWHATEYGLTHIELAGDDRTLLTWTEGSTARLWDLHTCSEIHPGALGDVTVHAAAWAEDEVYLVLFATDGSLWRWSPKRPLDKMMHFADGAGSGRFLADGARLAIHIATAKKFLIVDRHSGHVLSESTIQTNDSLHLGHAISPTRGNVALKGLQAIQIHSLATGSLLTSDATMSARPDMMSNDGALDWSPDGAWLVAAFERGPCLWHVDKARWSHYLQPRGTSRWASLRFSPDGRSIVGVGEGGELVVWDASTGRRRAARTSSNHWIHAVALATDRQTLLAASDGHIHHVNPSALVVGRTVSYKDEQAVAIAPDASAIVVAVERTLILADTRGDREIVLDRCTRTDHAAWDRCHFTCSGRHVVCRVSDGDRQELVAWDTAGRKVFSAPLDRNALYQTQTVALGRAVGICGGMVAGFGGVLDLYSSDGRTRLRAPDQTIYCLALDAGEKLLASSSQNNRIALWDLDRCIRSVSPVLLGELTTDWQLIEQLRFAPHGTLLAAASGDAVMLFDVASQRRLRKFTGHGFRVHSVAFSGDARHLIAGDWSGQLRVWSIASGKLVATFHVLDGETTVVARGGRCCVVGGGDDLAAWFGVASNTCHPLAAYPGAVVTPAELAAELGWDV